MAKCNYPECNCPIDMGSEHRCLLGLDEKVAGFPVGSYVRCLTSNRVFVVAGYSCGNTLVPDGWLVDASGLSANPAFCRLYSGATSVLNGL